MGKPVFKIFTKKEIRDIYEASLKVMEETGAKIYSLEALKLLSNYGCKLENERVFIPSKIVEKALKDTPQKFMFYNREGNPAFEIGGSESHFGTGPTTPFTIDIYTHERRPTKVTDIAEAARICDALKNIEWIMPLGSAQDVPAKVADVHEFEAAVSNTQKPIAFICSDARGVKDVIDMAAVVRGDRNSVSKKPFILAFPEPICPLVHPYDAVEEILCAAEENIPLAYFPSPMNGATSPVTLAGTIVLALADALTGLVIAQLKRPGTRIVLGIATNIMDMSSGSLSHGPGEFSLGVAAHAEVLRFLKIPSWGTAGLTDAKCLDEQSGIESTFSLLMNALGGLNMVHDSGYMEMGITGSSELVVMNDEIITMVRRILQGIQVNEDTLAVDVIHAVGPGGNFLAEEHTVKYCRQEVVQMNLMDRSVYDVWKDKPMHTLHERVNARTREILENHKPIALLPDVRKKLEEIRHRSIANRIKS